MQFASFANAPSGSGPTDFSASINWGDRSTSPGTIAASGAAFTISGQHVYVEGGSYKFTVTLTGKGIRLTRLKGVAAVAYVPLTVNANSIGAFAGVTQSFTVGSFNDPAGLNKHSFYVARISWGDGTKSTGSLVVNSSGGYNVVASHRYRRAASRITTVSVTDHTARPVTGSATASVAAIQSTQSIVEDQSGGTVDTPGGSEISIPAGMIGASVVTNVEVLSASTEVPQSPA